LGEGGGWASRPGSLHSLWEAATANGTADGLGSGQSSWLLALREFSGLALQSACGVRHFIPSLPSSPRFHLCLPAPACWFTTSPACP
jgi:hypothetical protein